ncbi:MAG TPA: hypothetical protein VJJ82_01640 [Candidatus Nanoarchaeia archaeon]|nr:hypothetical protein [Candidatus Nanoarchaeia archaeon]
MKESGMSKLGVWAFVIGLVLAVIIAIVGAAAPPAWAIVLLALVGIVVGLLNIQDREVQLFLVAGIGFLLSFQALAVVLQSVAFGWSGAAIFFGLLSVFIAPATAIVGLRALYNVAKD